MNLDKFFEEEGSESNVAKGLISGFLGGLAGTVVKAAAERFLEVRWVNEKQVQRQVIEQFSSKLTGSGLNDAQDQVVDQLVRIPLGASVGAAYGYGKRDHQDINLLDGAMLGVTTWLATHDTTLPILGVPKTDEDISLKVQANELVAHLLYGLTTEAVRSVVNKGLNEIQED